MPQSDDLDPEVSRDAPNQEALRRLDERIGAFEASRARKAEVHKAEQGHDGYRVLADLIGGILGGLGFGWLLDQLLHISPWGLIGGMLIGTGLSIFMVVRTAGRMGNKTSIAPGPDKPLLGDEDDDED
jgi:ATP synthase protein I